MLCNNPKDKHSCGKCSIDIISLKLVQNITIVQVAKIGASIVHMKEFGNNSDIPSALESATITCTGTINLSTLDDSNTIDCCIAKTLYCQLFENWYTCHLTPIEYQSRREIKRILSLINNTNIISRIRTYSIAITKYLENITICNGRCTTVMPGKESSNCKFCLANIDSIMKFTAIGLIDVFDTLFYTVKETSDSDICIDLHSTYIACNGDISLNHPFRNSKSKQDISNLRSIYIQYLELWCSKNMVKSSDIDRIRNHIDNVKKAMSLTKIYYLNSDLMEILSKYY